MTEKRVTRLSRILKVIRDRSLGESMLPFRKEERNTRGSTFVCEGRWARYILRY